MHISAQLQHRPDPLLSSQAAPGLCPGVRETARRLRFFLAPGLALSSQSGCVPEAALPGACENRQPPSASSVAGSLPSTSHLILVKSQTEKQIHGTVSGGASGGKTHIKFITSCLCASSSLPSLRAPVLSRLHAFLCSPFHLRLKAAGDIARSDIRNGFVHVPLRKFNTLQ